MVGHKILPYPQMGEDVQKCCEKKCQLLPALTLTRPSLPEFPWHAQTLSLTVSASVLSSRSCRSQVGTSSLLGA